MSDNRTTELQSLSKLKMAGKLRYWRGTIEIPETELDERGINYKLRNASGTSARETVYWEYEKNGDARARSDGQRGNGWWWYGMTELKPCPFCGGSVHMTTVNNDDLPNKMHYFLCRSCCKKITLWSKSADLNNAEAEAIESWNTRAELEAATLGGGRLTAEQVCDAIFNGSSYASYDGAKYYADGIGMQAIADELNGLLGSGTCNPSGEWESISQTQEVRHVSCSECGHEFGMERRYSIPFERTLLVELPNFCPNCGAEVWTNGIRKPN